MKQLLLQALSRPKQTVRSPASEPLSAMEEVFPRPVSEQRPDVTFGKPLELGKLLVDSDHEDVSLVNIESRRVPGPRKSPESPPKEAVFPAKDPIEAEVRPARDSRRMEFEKPRHRPSQSPRPAPRSPPGEEEAKGKAVDEAKYRRHKNLPKLVYSKPSNRKLIKNAVLQVCLAGEAYKLQREEVLKLIEDHSDVCNFVIVFRGELGRQDLKALYEYDSTTEAVRKLYGPGMWPDVLEPALVHSYYRYDSGAKEFRLLQCHGFSISTDAVVLKIGQKVPKNALF